MVKVSVSSLGFTIFMIFRTVPFNGIGMTAIPLSEPGGRLLFLLNFLADNLAFFIFPISPYLPFHFFAALINLSRTGGGIFLFVQAIFLVFSSSSWRTEDRLLTFYPFQRVGRESWQ